LDFSFWGVRELGLAGTFGSGTLGTGGEEEQLFGGNWRRRRELWGGLRRVLELSRVDSQLPISPQPSPTPIL
jgi:hypothetical protein